MQAFSTSRMPTAWLTWLRWLSANAIGSGVGLTFGVFLFSQREGIADHGLSLIIGILGWALVGLSVGVAQWLSLDQPVRNAWWVVATLVAWGAGGFLASGLPSVAVASAALIGILQSITLNVRFKWMMLWTAANVVGWGAGVFILAVKPLLIGPVPYDVAVFLSGCIIGAVGGSVTGIVLIHFAPARNQTGRTKRQHGNTA